MDSPASTFGKLALLVLAVAFVGITAGPAGAGTIVRFDTNMGTFDVELYDAVAPITVTNFLSYVNADAYDNTIIHRTVNNFVVQGGGYTMPNWSPLPNNGTIPLEYTLPNERGTLSMARAFQPNSAHTQWFINTVDNSTGLAPGGFSEGGYAVFGRVLGDGMDVVDAIEDLTRFNLRDLLSSPVFGEVPVIEYSQQHYAAGVNPRPFAVIVHSINVVPEPASWLLAGCGGAALCGIGWRKSRRRRSL